MRVMNGEPIDFELPFPKSVTKEMYYELISKVLSELRVQVKEKVDKFRETSPKLMTVEDRDTILKSVDGAKVREQVLNEFGVDTQGIKAADVLKNAFYTYSADRFQTKSYRYI